MMRTRSTTSSRRAFGLYLLGGLLLACTGCMSKPADTQAPSASQPEIPLAQRRQIEAGLKSADAKVRSQTLKGIAGLGKSAESVKPQLAELAERDPDPQVRQQAESLLKSLGR